METEDVIRAHINLMTAVIDPVRYNRSTGRLRVKKERLPPLGHEWLDLAAEILNLEPDIVQEGYRERRDKSALQGLGHAEIRAEM